MTLPAITVVIGVTMTMTILQPPQAVLIGEAEVQTAPVLPLRIPDMTVISDRLRMTLRFGILFLLFYIIYFINSYVRKYVCNTLV